MNTIIITSNDYIMIELSQWNLSTFTCIRNIAGHFSAQVKFLVIWKKFCFRWVMLWKKQLGK